MESHAFEGDPFFMREKVQKIVITFRIDPKLKEAAKKVAREAKRTLSKYVEELIRIDLWRKHIPG
jgi:predicted HicB family RNase H-like nuclease